MTTPRKQLQSAGKRAQNSSPFPAGLAGTPLMSPPGARPQTQPRTLLQQLEHSGKQAAAAQHGPRAGRIAAAHSPPLPAPSAPAAPQPQVSETESDSEAPAAAQAEPADEPCAATGADCTAEQPEPDMPPAAAQPQPLVAYSLTHVSEEGQGDDMDAEISSPPLADTLPPAAAGSLVQAARDAAGAARMPPTGVSIAQAIKGARPNVHIAGLPGCCLVLHLATCALQLNYHPHAV